MWIVGIELLNSFLAVVIDHFGLLGNKISTLLTLVPVLKDFCIEFIDQYSSFTERLKPQLQGIFFLAPGGCIFNLLTLEYSK